MNKTLIRVLLVEDNPGDARLIEGMLVGFEDSPYKVVHVDRLSKAMDYLLKEDVDVILLDLELPDSSGLDTLGKVLSQKPHLPILVLTGLDDKTLALEAVREGAQDYFIKGQFSGQLLINSIRYSIERKLAEEALKASLQEKEVLLKEIHHRVKNNMQIISSLLNIQARNIKDKEILEMFRETQGRIRSMAMVHERLYRFGDLARIDISEYILGLVNQLFQSYQVDASLIQFKPEMKNIHLDINTAIPLGLIVNELVSNALKHAFPGGRRGEIQVRLSPLENYAFKLTVKDNGLGFPEGLDFKRTETLGLQIVVMLVDQLDGTIEMERKDGTEFNIFFNKLGLKTGY